MQEHFSSWVKTSLSLKVPGNLVEKRALNTVTGRNVESTRVMRLFISECFAYCVQSGLLLRWKKKLSKTHLLPSSCSTVHKLIQIGAVRWLKTQRTFSQMWSFFLSVSFNYTDVCLFFGVIWLLKGGVSIRLKYLYCKCLSFIQAKLRCFVHFISFFYLTNNQFCHVSDQHNYWAPCQTQQCSFTQQQSHVL